jgi:hypothetical protein
MIGGWLSPAIRHVLQEEIAALHRLVTIGEHTLEEANAVLRVAMELGEAVQAGDLTPEEAIGLAERHADTLRDKARPS